MRLTSQSIHSLLGNRNKVSKLTTHLVVHFIARIAEGAGVEDVRKEVVVLRQQLSDRDETIIQLKEEVHCLRDQLLSSEVVKKEHADIRRVIGLHAIKTGIVNIHAHNNTIIVLLNFMYKYMW